MSPSRLGRQFFRVWNPVSEAALRLRYERHKETANQHPDGNVSPVS
jgi:hypothetical protein